MVKSDGNSIETLASVPELAGSAQTSPERAVLAFSLSRRMKDWENSAARAEFRVNSK